ncbi:disintegrin and metalloproteinase domain-containing protein 29-like [Sorex fumeus]|uniref:disintegrin and metalloproteinase domain-containing protein 29-like n=1 Tax=Sorex fumeus TaxID=62283 RepID=UPI0024ACB057|nr:disintegrin and metalloproteinase domain-containing protein 29-like [Sorex fumeus]
MQLLLFLLKLFLFLGRWPPTVHSQSQGPPEVTIPLKITVSDRGIRSSEWISYSLKFEGQSHIVHMKIIKHLMARHMPVFTYTDQGSLREDHPFIQNNCYYNGYMDGDPMSQVSINSCFGGFQGILQKNKTIYKIEPKMQSTTFEHLIYKVDDMHKEFPVRICDFKDNNFQKQMQLKENNDLSTSKQSGYKVWWTHKRYFTEGFVVSHDLFEFFEHNVSDTISKIFYMNIIITNIFKAIDMKPIIMGIEIWTEKNLFIAFTNYESVYKFCEWKRRTFTLRIFHNTAFFLLHHDHGKSYGTAFRKKHCSLEDNCSTINYRSEDNLHGIAFVISHQIGHILGFDHDEFNDDYCYCNDDFCLMNAHSRLANRISNCSYSKFFTIRGECFFVPPPPQYFYKEERCGNGMLEEGEDCDCGTIQECENDPCCEANCTLTLGAVCAFGLCCKDCKISPAGTLCRAKENECDLPEWCSGETSQCPEDVYVQGGIPCKGGGYCYEKRCNNREEQCKQIFGDQAKSADLSCYTETNIRGDRFGNCGMESVRYTQCHITDSLCGRIQCELVEEIPYLKNHTAFIITDISGFSCWSTDFHAGMTEPDLAEVKDGTECGENHFCVDRHCVPKSYFTKRCSPVKCNMHGICNNKNNCHCDPAWRPPFCYDEGVGGSLNSGPAPENISHDHEEFSEYEEPCRSLVV